MLRSVNRVLIGLTGLVLLGLGGSVLAGALWADPGTVLLSASARQRWRDQAWWWPVVLGGLAVLVLLALGWLVAQFRRPRPAEVLVDTRDGDGATLRGRALEAVMEEAAEAVEGVARARVRVTGAGDAPVAYVSVLLEPEASPDAVIAGLTHGVLARAREATGLPELPAEVQLRAASRRPRRVA